MFSPGRKEPAGSGKKPESEPGNRRVTTPLLMQTHATECGAACLGSVLAYFGRRVPFTELRGRCEVSRDGSTAAGIMRAARHYGLECRGRSASADQLKKLPLPMIIFWEFNHFLILEGFDGRRFHLNDPATGRRVLSTEEFGASFSGVALVFNPGPEFQRGGVRANLLQRLPVWLHGAWGALAYPAAAGLMLAVLALVTPAALGIFVDRVLGGSEPWGSVVAGVMAAAAVLVYGLTWLKQRWLQRLSARISVIAGNRCLSRLLRLPVEYFSHRLVGELTVRLLFIDRIARNLSEHFLGVLIEIAMSALTVGRAMLSPPSCWPRAFSSWCCPRSFPPHRSGCSPRSSSPSPWPPTSCSCRPCCWRWSGAAIPPKRPRGNSPRLSVPRYRGFPGSHLLNGGRPRAYDIDIARNTSTPAGGAAHLAWGFPPRHIKKTRRTPKREIALALRRAGEISQ